MNTKTSDLFPTPEQLRSAMLVVKGDIPIATVLKKTGIPRRTWNDMTTYSNSFRGPSLGFLKKFCEGMGVSVQALIAMALDEDYIFQSESFHALSEAQRQIVLAATDAEIMILGRLVHAARGGRDLEADLKLFTQILDAPEAMRNAALGLLKQAKRRAG